ncbi:MAG: hypothetical protein EBV83_06715 [Verrucomicrobia bacterium]|nr:hypothetical protein [Verrucomicrobiota bacterium]
MMKRVFLGWEEPVLAHSAKWLLSNFQDLSEVRVVVRGSRAGRRLLEKLAVEADRQKRALFLPKIATIARIVDELFTAPAGLLPVAPELTQKLAWMEALRRLSPAKKAKLFQTQKGLGESGQPELLLAQRLQTLRDELGGEGLGFAEVARLMSEKMPEAPEIEPERWELVEEVFAEGRKILEKAGWMDPAERRAVLAEKGTPQQVQVVLAGVVEIRPVFMKMLQRLSKPPQVLVFAPEKEKDGFDEAGRLRPEYWAKRRAGMESGQIHAVVRSADQAARLAEMAKAWPGATLALADEKAVAGIREALREPEEVSASVQAEKVSNMLVEIYGKMEVNLDLPSGRMMRDSLQKTRKVMTELASLKLPYLEKIRTADFLRLVLAEMEDERVPEPSRVGAVEMVGWLELAEEDAPSVAVASFHEGAVPRSVTADEFLPGHLREVLGVNDNMRRLARDAYALAVVLGTRAENRGIVGLVVPSFNPAGDPVKPSTGFPSPPSGTICKARAISIFGRSWVCSPWRMSPANFRRRDSAA